jgi:predicted dehydrogenase
MIGIGITGCGGMGTSLVREMVKVEGAKLTAAHDVDPQAARKVTDELGGEVVSSYEDLLGRGDIDAVVVATPGYLHRDPVIQAAKASKHVFCEKPMALNLEDCDMMIDACKEAGVNLMIGQVLRLIPVFKESARIVREELGKPLAMSTLRMGGWGYTKGWRATIEKSGGMLLEVNVHEFDYLRFVCGEPVEVFACGGRLAHDYIDFEDTVFSSFKFQSGAIGNLRAVVSSAIGQYTGEIICKEGALSYDNHTGTIRYRRFDGDEITITRDQLPEFGGVAEETSEFVHSIMENRKPDITGEDGRIAVEMALAVRRSIREGVPVKMGSR